MSASVAGISCDCGLGIIKQEVEMNHTDETQNSLHDHYNMLHCFCREREKMETKHTPGPWAVIESADKRSDGYVRAMPDEDGRRVAVAQVTRTHWSHSQSRANSKLIASSPELLEALEKGVSLIKGDLVGVDWKRACAEFIADANAAIAKATGATS